MKLSQDYVHVPSLAARSELKGAALAYFTAHAGREVWRSKVTLPGHLIATTNDPAAGGFPFKQFLPEGVHLGWAREQADGQLEFVRKNLSPITRSAAPATPASVYGEQHQVYAAAQCQSCGNRHAPSELITETETTRFKLLQFAAEISTITNPLIDAQRSFIRKRIAQVSLPPAPKVPPSEKKAADQARSAQLKTAQTAAETRATKIVQRPLLDQANREHAGWLAVTQGAVQPNPLYAPSRDTAPTMLGLLMCGTGANQKTHVAASGSFANSDARFAHVAALRGYTVCFTPKSPYQTLAGGTIPPDLYIGSKAEGAQAAGTCAAPRLISQAINYRCLGPLSSWHMSEIWYWQRGMPASDLVWVPGLTAYSCDTCQNLLPLFLCPTLTG